MITFCINLHVILQRILVLLNIFSNYSKVSYQRNECELRISISHYTYLVVRDFGEKSAQGYISNVNVKHAYTISKVTNAGVQSIELRKSTNFPGVAE